MPTVSKHFLFTDLVCWQLKRNQSESELDEEEDEDDDEEWKPSKAFLLSFCRDNETFLKKRYFKSNCAPSLSCEIFSCP